MKLISLWEPWATLMELKYKRVETRDWPTNYTGALAIHASKGGLSLEALLDTCLQPVFYNALMTYPPFRDRMIHYVQCPRPADVNKRAMKDVFPDRGKIRAVVNLQGCWPTKTFAGRHPKVLTTTELAFGNYDHIDEVTNRPRQGWLTEFIFKVPVPVPFTSKQGLVDVPADIRAELLRQWNKEKAEEERTE